MGLNHQTMCLWAICMALQLVLFHVIILEQHNGVLVANRKKDGFDPNEDYSPPTNERTGDSVEEVETMRECPKVPKRMPLRLHLQWSTNLDFHIQ
jgi:hypothetical protein